MTLQPPCQAPSSLIMRLFGISCFQSSFLAQIAQFLFPPGAQAEAERLLARLRNSRQVQRAGVNIGLPLFGNIKALLH